MSREKIEMANILARALLESQYHEAIEKIKPQLDKEWLDSLVTEDDILDAAIKLTEAEASIYIPPKSPLRKGGL